MTAGLQPFLHDAIIALSAPTQAWSRADGDMRAPIDGIYHGDRRFLSAVTVEVGGAKPESIASASRDAARVVFDAVLRNVDDATPDPHVRLARERTVADGRMSEALTIASVATASVTTVLRVRLTPDFRTLSEVKAGAGAAAAWTAAEYEDGVLLTSDACSLTISAPGAQWARDGDDLVLEWALEIERGTSATSTWTARMVDPSIVIRGVSSPAEWVADTGGVDPRLARWVTTALDDLAALRLALPQHPDDVFLAAGAPWFLTLFGRDSLWAARMMLPVDVELAASTLRVLARLQGRRDDPATEEEPGKIAHELRAAELTIPGEGIVLPPLYYGTVDATALWVCLLVDAAERGMAEAQVRELLPNLRAALEWMMRSAADDGFLSYIDRTGRGLANQGWKDSGDSIQWRDGTLAAGPIALCEVQGYAYEAAVGAAALLDRLGERGGVGERHGDSLRAWADGLRSRFQERFWVTTPEGRYPAIALDRDGRAVDTLTSNIGHLLGTGILSPDDEAHIARLLVGPSMSSGFGVRTMSTDAAGYWPLSYHGGAVWTHDSAIIAHGMARAGLHDEARIVVEGLLDAAEAFGFRMPELHGGFARGAVGDPRGTGERPAPVPYPAACRPQAWAATAAITCLEIAHTDR